MTTWVKSSHSFSNGNCTEVAGWRKSSASVSGGCMEVADGVAVRDSKDPDGPVLRFTSEEWQAFIRRVQR